MAGILKRLAVLVAVGPRETTEIPEGAEVIDLVGTKIIPGLADMHAHYGTDRAAAEAMMRTQLYYGITTVRSIGTDNAELMLEANAGRPDTPRMFTAGRGFTYPGGFIAGAQQPTTEEEAREMVRTLAGQGVHYVKMWVNEMPEPGFKITPEMRTSIVEEAIANGLVSVAHIDEEADGRQLVESGLGDFPHSTVLTFGPGSGAPVDDPEPSAEFIRIYLDNNVSFMSTLSIVQSNWHFAERRELLVDTDLRATVNPLAVERWSDPEARVEVVETENVEDRKAAFRQLQDFVKTMHDAGVCVTFSTASGTANVPMGWGTHHDLELYVQDGLTPMPAIVAATATNAPVTPRVEEAEFGTLEAGNIADLVVLDGDSLEDTRNMLSIDRVMKGGAWVDRAGLLPVRQLHL